MERPRIQIVSIVIASLGESKSFEESSIQNYDTIEGVFCESSKDLSQCTMSLEVDGQEIFPKKFAPVLIQTSENLSYQDVTYEFKERAAGSTIKGEFKDGGVTGNIPYTVNLYFLCKEGKD